MPLPSSKRGGHAARDAPTSKRWETAMHSEMEKTAAALRLLTKDDRDATRKDLADRKINNTRTSISFGHEKITYISDAMQNQKLILNASNDDKAEQKLRVKEMKTNLTKTNFKMGDDRDTTEYMSTNQMGMLQVIQHPQVGTKSTPRLDWTRLDYYDL